MSKTSFRSIVATLCTLFLSGFLAACGGGEDGGVNIPADAKVCELKDYQPPSHPLIDPANLIHSDGDGIVLHVELSEDGTKYTVSNWQPFYVTVLTWGENDLSGLVSDRVTVPVNKRSLIYYYNYLGTLNGRHVRGSDGWANWITLGTDSPSLEDQVSPEEVAGIEPPIHGGAWPRSPHVMSEPRLTQLDQHLFRVEEGLHQGVDWARLPNATVQFEVLTDSGTGGSSGYRHCELTGLTGPVNTIAITGGRPGESYWVKTITYAPLDGNVSAYSKSIFVQFMY